MNITIETNSLIDIEQGFADGVILSDCIRTSLHGLHRVRLPAISASELQKDGKYLRDFGIFLQRVTAIGLSKEDLLLPLAYWGVAFWDHALYSSKEAERLEKGIHHILFPAELYECPEGLGDEFNSEIPNPDYVKWRNAKCDVLAMWCHIFHGGDVFVTRDRNFHKKQKMKRLIALGAKRIIRPSELPGFLRTSSNNE